MVLNALGDKNTRDMGSYNSPLETGFVVLMRWTCNLMRQLQVWMGYTGKDVAEAGTIGHENSSKHQCRSVIYLLNFPRPFVCHLNFTLKRDFVVIGCIGCSATTSDKLDKVGPAGSRVNAL